MHETRYLCFMWLHEDPAGEKAICPIPFRELRSGLRKLFLSYVLRENAGPMGEFPASELVRAMAKSTLFR